MFHFDAAHVALAVAAVKECTPCHAVQYYKVASRRRQLTADSQLNALF